MRSLTEWETYLRSYFQRRLRLIGEIPLRRRDVEELADLLSERYEIVRQESVVQATEELKSKYPHSFTVFLTAFATFNDQRNYWRTLSERLNIPEGQINNYRWRHIAYDFIKKKDLPVLTEDQASDKYVATLRFHGGIPAYSLPDFFSRIVLPSIQRTEYAELSSERALKVILDGIYNVDSPVINFLTYSGELGEEFFASCREMARRYIKDQELVTPEELDLPPYLVEAFSNFMETSQDKTVHLRKPYLLFNPYDDPPLRLHLPEEQIPLRFVEDEIYWQITWQGQSSSIEKTPALRKQRQDVLIREADLPLETLPPLLKVSLLRRRESGAHQPVRRWTLPCLPPEDQPLFATRANGQLLSSMQELPGEALLLVFPGDIQLQTEGVANLIETYPALGGALSGWKAEAWDLTDAQSLHLIRDGEEICPPIPIGFAYQSPILAGTTCQYNDDPSGIPLYAGHAPILRIPLRSGCPLEDELNRWRVEIRSHWETFPNLNVEASPTAYRDNVNVTDENFADFNLAPLLGEDAAGTFNLRVRSQYETEAEFRFRVWPSLYVIGLDKFIFPSSEGAQSTSFNLRLPGGAHCEIQPGADGFSLDPSIVATKVNADADCTRVDLYLTKPLKDSDKIRVPISIPLPRLRWKLLVGTSEIEPDWTTRPIQKTIDSILQAPSASLHLTMHGIHEIADRVSLLLIDPNEPGKIIQEEKSLISTLDQDVLRLPLSPFRTTLAGYEQAAQMELHLFYRAPNFDESVRVPLVFLSRQLGISDVAFTQIGDLTWRLSWDEPNPLRNRRASIDSVWQPWQELWDYQIPDKARGNFILNDIGLLPSHYRIAFYTAPSGELPSEDFLEENTFDIFTCSPIERIAQLESQSILSPESDFRRHFELACILSELDKPYDIQINKCLEHLKNRAITSLHLLLGFHNWLEDLSITLGDSGLKSNVSAVRYWLYTPEVVNYVIRQLRRTDPQRLQYLELITSAKYLYPESATLLVSNVDNPKVVNYCLKYLLERDEENTIYLILDLVQSARLNNKDAAYLFLSCCQSALHSLLQVPTSNTRDSLIVSLLQAIENPVQAVDTVPSDILINLLPQVDEVKLRKVLLKTLLERQEPVGMAAIMQAYRDKALDDLDVRELISTNVSFSLKLLQSAPPIEPHLQQINALIHDYPVETGFIIISSRLVTPAGIGVVKAINTEDGKSVERIQSSTNNFSVGLELATGESVLLDFKMMTLEFLRGQRVFACTICNQFAATDNRALNTHQKDEHRYTSPSLRTMPVKFSVDVEKIQILPPK